MILPRMNGQPFRIGHLVTGWIGKVKMVIIGYIAV